jgi:hypothetical protein
LLVVQLTVVAPGALALVGLTEIEPETGLAVKFAVTVQLLWMFVRLADGVLAGGVAVPDSDQLLNCQPAAALAVRVVNEPCGMLLDGLAEAVQPAVAAPAGATFTAVME